MDKGDNVAVKWHWLAAEKLFLNRKIYQMVICGSKRTEHILI